MDGWIINHSNIHVLTLYVSELANFMLRAVVNHVTCPRKFNGSNILVYKQEKQNRIKNNIICIYYINNDYKLRIMYALKQVFALFNHSRGGLFFKQIT